LVSRELANRCIDALVQRIFAPDCLGRDFVARLAAARLNLNESAGDGLAWQDCVGVNLFVVWSVPGG
jgi:hypothetical protein